MRMEVPVGMRGRLLVGLVTLGLLLPAASASGAASSRSGQLAMVKIIIRGLGEQPPAQSLREARILDPLYTRYLLRTQAKQKARLQFVDGTTLNINQRTDAVLQDPNHTIVNQGEVDQVDKHGTAHRIQANGAVATANGTNFDVKVVNGRIFFVVDRGHITVSSSGGRVTLARNQESIVVGRGRPGPIRHVNADAIIAWTRGLNSDGWSPITQLHPNNTKYAPSDATGLAVGGGHIFALGGDGGIAELTTSGKPVRAFGPRTFLTGIAIDPGKHIYVVPNSPSGSSPHISEYSATGKLIAKIPLPVGQQGGFSTYKGLAVDSHGDLWTYTDNLPSGQLGLLKLSPSGAVLATIPGTFVNVAVDRQDNVFAIGHSKSSVNNVIHEFSPTGQVLATWTFVGPHTTLPQFGGLTISRKGRIFAAANSLQQGKPPYEVADTGGYVFEITHTGKLRSIWGKAYGRWPAAGAFLIGGAIAVDAKGNVYVVDNDRIQKLPWFDT